MAPGPKSRTNRLANCRLPLLSFVSHSELGLFFLLNAVWIKKNFDAFDLIAQSSSSAPPSFPSNQFANLKSCGWRH